MSLHVCGVKRALVTLKASGSLHNIPNEDWEIRFSILSSASKKNPKKTTFKCIFATPVCKNYRKATEISEIRRVTVKGGPREGETRSFSCQTQMVLSHGPRCCRQSCCSCHSGPQPEIQRPDHQLLPELDCGETQSAPIRRLPKQACEQPYVKLPFVLYHQVYGFNVLLNRTYFAPSCIGFVM